MRLTVLGLLLFLPFAVIGSIPLLFVGNIYLRCERRADGAGSCEFVNGSLLRSQRTSFLLGEPRRAEFRRIPRRSSNGRFEISPELQVVLHTKRGQLPLGIPTIPSRGSSSERDLSAKARRIQDFLTSTRTDTFKEGEDNTLMIALFLLGFGGMGAAAALLVPQP
jgi:hypothetical protein